MSEPDTVYVRTRTRRYNSFAQSAGRPENTSRRPCRRCNVSTAAQSSQAVATCGGVAKVLLRRAVIFGTDRAAVRSRASGRTGDGRANTCVCECVSCVRVCARARVMRTGVRPASAAAGAAPSRPVHSPQRPAISFSIYKLFN